MSEQAGPVHYIAVEDRGQPWAVVRCYDDGADAFHEVVARATTEQWAKALARRLDITEEPDDDSAE